MAATNWVVRQAAISFTALLLAGSMQQASADGPRPLADSVHEASSGRANEDDTLEQLRETFDLFPYNEGVRKRLTAAYTAIGKRQLDLKEFDKAAENFENARKLAPDNQEFGLLKGIALYLGKHLDAAAIELEQARRYGGDNPVLLFYLGRAYYDLGELTEAIEMWEKTVAIEPDNKAVLAMVAKARREASVESRMEHGYSSMFVVSYDEGTRPDLADAILDVLENAYNQVGYDLSYYPVTRIPVILYTRKDYRDVTKSPDWSGGLYDGKVRLPIGGANVITPQLRGVLFHEYTHVVVGEITKGNCPTWLNEGLAEVEGRREFNTPPSELVSAAKAGTFTPFSSLEKSLASLSAKDAVLAYQQSYAMVSFMISAYGWHKVRDILVNLGAGKSIDAAISAALADYRLDFMSIEREWRVQMLKEYGAN